MSLSLHRKGHYARYIYDAAKGIRRKIVFLFYRFAEGLRVIFGYARDSPRGYLKPIARKRRKTFEQLDILSFRILVA